jgi:hypothetical protein
MKPQLRPRTRGHCATLRSSQPVDLPGYLATRAASARALRSSRDRSRTPPSTRGSDGRVRLLRVERLSGDVESVRTVTHRPGDSGQRDRRD